jgi:hypothetical protein
VLFFGVVLGGGLQKAGEWVGEQMVEQVAPADPAPAETPSSRTKKKQERPQRQSR